MKFGLFELCNMAHIVKLPAFSRQGNGSSLLATIICKDWVNKFEHVIRTGNYDNLDTVDPGLSYIQLGFPHYS